MRAWHIVPLLTVFGCGGDTDEPVDTDTGEPTDTTPPEDTGPFTDTAPPTTPPACAADVFITDAEGGCFGSDYAYEFKADLAGCADTAVLNLWRTDGTPWDEQHAMGILAEGPDGVWQAWEVGPLTHQAGTDAWVPGATTAFDCQADLDKVTFAVRMFHADGTLADCAVWGHDPALVIAGGASAINSDPAASFASCTAEPF